ncbi:MAG TPA: hypothetical protein VHC39_04690 [Rhizomicrobium sp.]|nr:hypothetical protein [Rhizomicrobium sp.]
MDLILSKKITFDNGTVMSACFNLGNAVNAVACAAKPIMFWFIYRGRGALLRFFFSGKVVAGGVMGERRWEIF